MPLPAPKLLDHVFNRLNELLITGKKLGDIEAHQMEKELKDAIHSQPHNAYLGLATIATLKNDEDLMRYNMEKAFPYCQGSYQWHYNFGVNLINFGCPEEAIEQFKLSLEASGDIRPWLRDLAHYALVLDDAELSLKVLQTAERFKVKDGLLSSLAVNFLAASAETEDESLTILNNLYSDKMLEKFSHPLSDEEWSEMQNLADELEKYL